MNFTDIFIRRPVLALVVSLLILLIGLKCMLGLQIRQYPRLYNTTITVTTVYPGASVRSGAAGAPALVDRRRPRLGRYSRRPDLRDAAVARPGPDGGARHLRLGRRGGDPRQQLPVGARPGEGLLHRHQHQRADRP